MGYVFSTALSLSLVSLSYILTLACLATYRTL